MAGTNKLRFLLQLQQQQMNHILPLKSKVIFTWWGDPVLVGRFVVAQGEQQDLDGSGKDSRQAQVEYHIEQEDLDCQWKD